MYRLQTLAMLLCIMCCNATCAAEIMGQVAEVQGQELSIRLAPGAAAHNGDAVQVFMEKQGGVEATIATAVVTNVHGDSVVAKVEQATGQIMPGQKVRLTPAGAAASSPASGKTATVDPRDTRFPPWPTIKPNQPWIGESRWLADQREVVLCGVLKDGPAGKAGLRVDDTILSIAGQRIRNVADYHKAIDAHQPGQTVDFEIERDGQKRTIPVTLEAIPPDGGNGRILAAAEAGESWAMMDIGVRYANMRGNVSYFQENDAEAVRWFRRATDAGYAAGPLFLAHMYYNGKGVVKDYVEAAKLYEQARTSTGEGVHKGLFGSATDSLAQLYFNGWGVAKDLAKAAQLYREAADNGSVLATYRLGSMYENGQGVSQSFGKALELYQAAAKEEYAAAQSGLGRMCAEGTGVARDDAIAAQWFRLAADQGLAEAQDYLAFLSAEGRGVPRDRDEAIRWYRKAAAQGDAHAIESLKALGVAVTADTSTEPAASSAAPATARATLDYFPIRVPEGQLLWGVFPEGAAAQAGLRSGDVITLLDGAPPFTFTRSDGRVGKLLAVMRDHRPGDHVQVDYLRGGQAGSTTVTLAAYPADDGLARLETVAATGQLWAIHAAGVCHFMNAEATTGAESEKEYALAVPWFFKGSEANFAWSQLFLGNLYTAGHGVPQSDEQAGLYYEKVRHAVGNPLDRLAFMIALAQLGRFALKAVPPDDQRAIALFREAAEAGSASGQDLLGWMYEHGRGVPADRNEAVRWYQKAAAQGNADAISRLQRLGVSS